MTLQTSGTICISDLKTEFSSSSNCLTSYYAGGGVVPSGASGTNGAVPTSGNICLTDFYGVSNVIPVVSNVQNYTGNRAAEFYRVTTGSGGFVYGLIEYQLVVRTTTSGSNYVATLYVEETNNGLGVYNSSAMTTGTLYPVQTVTFTQGNWPDSYALDHSVVTQSAGGPVQASTFLGPGTGETYSFTTNWDNTTFTLLNPTSSTAGEVGHFTTGECFNGTVIYTDTFIWKFIKSGYPTLSAATFSIHTEQDMAHTGLCP
jgi:hypothetical protein